MNMSDQAGRALLHVLLACALQDSADHAIVPCTIAAWGLRGAGNTSEDRQALLAKAGLQLFAGAPPRWRAPPRPWYDVTVHAHFLERTRRFLLACSVQRLDGMALGAW
eukprot:3514411-Rhodomonas_salina.2